MAVRASSRTWRWPRYAVVAPLDTAIALQVFALLCIISLQSYARYPAQARLIELFTAANEARNEVIEKFALSGEPYDMAGERSEIAVEFSVSDHLKRPDAVLYDLIQAGLSQPMGSIGDERMNASKYVSSLRIDGSAVIVAGHVDGLGAGEYQLALTPLVDDGGVPQVLAWQCGGKAMPRGWTGPTVVMQRPIDPTWLPRQCRRFPSDPQ